MVAELELDIRECSDDLLNRLEMEVRRGRKGGGRLDVLLISYVPDGILIAYVHVSGPLRNARPVT
jgi:hypothetical protein